MPAVVRALVRTSSLAVLFAGAMPFAALSVPAAAAATKTASCNLLSNSELDSVLGVKLPAVVAIKPPAVPGVPASIANSLTCNWGALSQKHWANLVFQPTSSATWGSEYRASANTVVKTLGVPAYAWPVFGPKGSDTLLYAYVKGMDVSVGAPAPLSEVETLMKKVLAEH